ncbi:type II secretion system secretin GspD [Brenneria populi subsp. brevivirga]|uniref:type II secretion system secretin GspD n=1 Tax=Brenneria populi TaxID=1505588 RepID=UPI002E18450D|nr:type II secretion system secretin GspD [Brenneria populi subsp. brevivirga]
MKHRTARRTFTGGVLVCGLALSGCTTSESPQESLFRAGTYVPSSGTTGTPRAQSAADAGKRAESDARQRVVRPVGQNRPGSPAAVTRRPLFATDEKVTLSFSNVEIEAVVAAMSRFLGRHFLIDPRVKGQLTLVSEGAVPADAAYDMLVSALRMRGFAIVDVGDVSRVVPAADARTQGGAVNAAAPGGGIATRTFRLAYEKAEALVGVLKPMIAPESSIAAYAANNTLVVTDYVDNLDRIARIIESIDTPTALDTEVVPVYNGIAVDIAGLANELLQNNDNQRDIAVLADPRSNSVIIRASSPARTALARDLIVELDNVQQDPGNLHVVYLRNAQASSLMKVLRGLLTGDSGGSALGSEGDARAALGAGGMLGAAGSTATNGGASSASTGAAGQSSTAVSQRFASGAQDAAAGAEESGAFSAGGVTVQADPTTNTLIISAPEPMYRSLRSVIDLLDQRRAQVLVETLIVEVLENDAAEFGIQWMRNGGRFIGGANLGGAGLNTSATNTIDLLPQGLNLGIINGTVTLPGVGEIVNLEVLARALQSKGGANILSTPNILTLDNEPASIMVGKTVPFVSGQYVTSGGSSDNPFQTVEREDVGLKLNIRPQISEGGAVKLDIYQEVSSIDEQSTTSAGVVTNKRALDTSVLLDDGQIMVLGGLLDDNVTVQSESVPILGSIPLLGALFRYDKRASVKTNLMIFLRPYVIRNADAGRGLTQDRYNFMRTLQSRVQPGGHPLLPDMSAPILPPSSLAATRGALDLRAGATRRPSTAASGHPAVFHAAPVGNMSVLQVADAAREGDAVAIAKRVRVGGLQAYIVAAPAGAGYAVRVEVPRDAASVDKAVAALRELGYAPEIVVTP